MPAKSKTASKASPKRSGFLLNPPKMVTFWAAVIIAVVGLLAYVLYIANLLAFTWLSPLAFVLVAVAFVLLLLGLLVKGL
jgi:hypothetical protein